MPKYLHANFVWEQKLENKCEFRDFVLNIMRDN